MSGPSRADSWRRCPRWSAKGRTNRWWTCAAGRHGGGPLGWPPCCAWRRPSGRCGRFPRCGCECRRRCPRSRSAPHRSTPVAACTSSRSPRPPTRLDLVLAAAGRGQVIVVVPQRDAADRLARGVRRSGAAVARWPRDFAAAAGGATVVGGRAAVFAPAPALASIVVIDEHDEMLQSEASPTWHAREVAIERARRAGVPCLLVSPCPSLEALAAQRSDGGAGLWAPAGPGVAGGTDVGASRTC